MHNLTLLTVVLSIFSSHASSSKDLWKEYKTVYAKVYSSDSEEFYRSQIFYQNLELINEIQQIDSSAEYGITKFCDISPDEFEAMYLHSIQHSMDSTQLLGISDEQHIMDPAPDSWDWRDQGAVTPIKDQGICGAYWTFSAIGAIEGQYYLKYNVSYNFSEQQLIDCDTIDKGCYGDGSIIGVYTWLSQNGGGLESSSDYPYFGYQMACGMNSSFEIAKVTGYVNVSQDEGDIAQTLYDKGPLSTGINSYWLQFYKKGVMSPVACPKKLNHGVTLIGFGSEQDQGKEVDFWIVKNSWGQNWGEDGFFRIKRGSGTCGINLNVTLPIIE